VRNEPIPNEDELFWRTFISVFSTAALMALAITVLVLSV
jgi:hypothetical protein